MMLGLLEMNMIAIWKNVIACISTKLSLVKFYCFRILHKNIQVILPYLGKRFIN